MYTFVITPLTLSISTSELVFMSTFIGILGNASKTLSSKGIRQSSFLTSHVTPIGIKKIVAQTKYSKQLVSKNVYVIT